MTPADAFLAGIVATLGVLLGAALAYFFCRDRRLWWNRDGKAHPRRGWYGLVRCYICGHESMEYASPVGEHGEPASTLVCSQCGNLSARPASSYDAA